MPQSDGATYVALTPARLFDTRQASFGGALQAGQKRTFHIAGLGGVPADAVAVTGNLTTTGSTASGYLTIAPSLTSNKAPGTSTLNFARSATLANGVTVPLSSAGTIDVIFWSNTKSSTTQAIFDVTGYFATGG